MEEKKTKVTVIVPTREGGHSGWFAAGRKWESGQEYNVELTDAEIQNIASRPGMIVQLAGKTVKAVQSVPQSVSPAGLSADEQVLLEKYRAEKSRNPAVAKEFGGSEAPKFTTTDETDASAPPPPPADEPPPAPVTPPSTPKPVVEHSMPSQSSKGHKK